MNKLELSQIYGALYVCAFLYCIVLFAIIADLISGVRKAKKRGDARTSTGYKKTVDKITRYYNMLFVVSLIDVILVVSQVHSLFHIPVLPYFTAVGALALCLIELKSIYESAEDKLKKEISGVGSLAGSIIKNKGDVEAIISEIAKRLEENKNETTTEKNS
jgi:phage-related holin